MSCLHALIIIFLKIELISLFVNEDESRTLSNFIFYACLLSNISTYMYISKCLLTHYIILLAKNLRISVLVSPDYIEIGQLYSDITPCVDFKMATGFLLHASGSSIHFYRMF